MAAPTHPATGRYCGRFAPSPTGPLHLGSLLAAVASFLQARTRGGAWRLRIEDLDPPRAVAGAADAILRTLEAFGLHWDGEVRYQSGRGDAYAQAVERLRRTGHVYPCACSRREIADSARAGIEGAVYPGTCRAGIAAGRTARALRVRTDAAAITVVDGIQGPVTLDLAREVGDFVVRRADGPYAYQLAVVVDDAEDGVTEVVRGADLLYSTHRQIHLQRLLDLPSPHYRHIPVLTDRDGRKLSKSGGDAAVDPRNPSPTLWRALDLLGQSPPPELRRVPVGELWGWAREHWRVDAVPRIRSVSLTG